LNINTRFLQHFSCSRFTEIFIDAIYTPSNGLPEVTLISSLYQQNLPIHFMDHYQNRNGDFQDTENTFLLKPLD
jgi:hypothetical protein